MRARTIPVLLVLVFGCRRGPPSIRSDLVDADLPSTPNDSDRLKAFLEQGDDELVANVLSTLDKKAATGSPLTSEQQTLMDGEYAFILVSDDGLSWFEEYPAAEYSAELARRSLSDLGLPEHAAILAELIEARATGGLAPARMVDLAKQWDDVSPPPNHTVARWIRAHMSELHLAEIAGSEQR